MWGPRGRQMQKNIDFLFVPVGEGATPPRGPQEAHFPSGNRTPALLCGTIAT